ncbi:hypothetical protein C900_04045 [Fulvivirga imtechensis AK7]|uniref:DUF4097 domain-containing protein n=1 Tax=Fulvivirga imtechensis AK7 TaxID=1237149 RepID=L8JNF9_9BACT|nr:DUF4097 family beta strand repeat-containing protein [Fulvivirga imtechensis]ELR70360.1 hypothetical protein C900_04045 [Fulvivirga imtechensis AK7]
MKKINTLLFVALLLIAPRVIVAQEMSRSFSGVKKINLSTSSGDCILKKGSNHEVGVHLKHSFGSGYQPVIEQQGERLTIKEDFKKGSHRGSSKWTLTIPDGVDIKVNSGSGNMEAENLEINLKMNTGSGDIDFSRVSGDIDINTGSGDIALKGFTGDIKANTGSGNISAYRISGELKFNCGSGNISIKDSEAIFSANVGSGSIKATSVTLKGKSSFNSGSGDVEVFLASALQHNIALSSGSGDARLDFRGKKIEGEIVMKANKRNGAIKAPFDFDTIEEIDQDHNQIIVKKTAVIGDSKVKIQISTGSGTASIQ